MQGQPRINGAMMTQYQQATVRLVGRVQSVDDNTATLLTSDGKTVVVHRGNGGRYTDEIVEVVGQVNGDSLTEAAVYGFGDAETFSMQNYDTMVQLANNQMRSLFY